MLPDKQAQHQLPTNIIGLGSLQSESLRNFRPADVFTIVKSKKPQLHAGSVPLTLELISDRQERAKSARLYLRHQKVDKIHEYLLKVMLRAIDCELAELQFRIDTVNKLLARNEICIEKQRENAAEHARKVERQHQRAAQARIRRIIIGEAQIRFCQSISKIEINSLA